MTPTAERTSEGLELPNEPGAWYCDGKPWLVSISDSHAEGELYATGLRDNGYPIVMKVGAMEFPRGGWLPATPSQPASAERVEGELPTVRGRAVRLVPCHDGFAIVENALNSKAYLRAGGFWVGFQGEYDEWPTREDAIAFIRQHADQRQPVKSRSVLKREAIMSGEEMPTQFDDQRQPAAHPEDRCGMCGGPNIVWFVESPLWNRFVREKGHPEILCPICFAKLAEAASYEPTAWQLVPENPPELSQPVTEPRSQEVVEGDQKGGFHAAEVVAKHFFSIRGVPLVDGEPLSDRLRKLESRVAVMMRERLPTLTVDADLLMFLIALAAALPPDLAVATAEAREVDKLRQQLTQLIADTCEDDTAIRKLASEVIGSERTYGDSDCVPGIVEVVEAVVAHLRSELSEAHAELKRLRGEG